MSEWPCNDAKCNGDLCLNPCTFGDISVAVKRRVTSLMSPASADAQSKIEFSINFLIRKMKHIIIY